MRKRDDANEMRDARMTSSNEPAWYTFTFPLPYTMGLSDDLTHQIAAIDRGMHPQRQLSPWADPQAAKSFGEVPVVRIRFFRRATEGLDMAQPHLNDVIEALYGVAIHFDGSRLPRFGGDGTAYEQWVTLETAATRLVWEPAEDEAYAFHRCVSALEAFIEAYIVAFGMLNVVPLRTQDVGYVVWHGSFDHDNVWSPIGPVLMHIEQLPAYLEPRHIQDEAGRFNDAVEAVSGGHPMVSPKLWYWRARAAERRGDHVDHVVSLQTSMEGMLYATYLMMLIDQGNSSADIQRVLGDEIPYKTLLTRVLPPLLGGNWSLTDARYPVGQYWVSLYTLRNRVVHAGHQPSPQEAQVAQAGYVAMRQFINERVWAKRRTFPRTTMAKIGDPAAFGWKDEAYTKVAEQLLAQGRSTWWWPHDVLAHPENPST